MFIDETTPLAALQDAALFECGFTTTEILAASDAELLKMVRDWIEAGDECVR